MQREGSTQSSPNEERFLRKVDLAFGLSLLVIFVAAMANIVNVFYGNGWDPLEFREALADFTSVVFAAALMATALIVGVWKIISAIRE